MTYSQQFSKVDSDYCCPQNSSLKNCILVLITVFLLGSVFSGTLSTPFEIVFQAHLNLGLTWPTDVKD